MPSNFKAHGTTYRDLIKQGVPVSVLAGERLTAFDEYRNYYAFHPPGHRVVSFWIFITFVLVLLGWLLQELDRKFLSGLRFIPHLVVIYTILCILRLWLVCEWARWSAYRRGLEFEERFTFTASRESEIIKLKSTLECIGSNPKFADIPPKVVCIAGFGGGGHEATMSGVRAVMAEVGFKANFVDVPVGFLVETDELNPLWRLFRVTGEQLYNWGLRQGAFVAFAVTWATSFLQYFALRIDQLLGWLMDRIGIDHGDEASKLCCRLWTELEPDLICNFTTGTSRIIRSGLHRAGKLHTPVLVVVSDFEGVGVHRWIETRTDHIVCGTSLCRQQALETCVPTNQVFQTSGMILRPNFYETVEVGPDRGSMLEGMGLHPGRRTCLVFWGGIGNRKLLDAGLALQHCREPLNLIFLCGHNSELLQALKSITWSVNVLIEGFTPNVSFYMQISDLIVCKPGPGVTSEAALLGLPILVEWSAFTLPQEVAVCRWVLSRGLGLGFSRVGQLPGLVDRLVELMGPFQPSRKVRPVPLAAAGLSGVDVNPDANRAVFEVPAIIQRLLVSVSSDSHTTAAGPAGRSKAA